MIPAFFTLSEYRSASCSALLNPTDLGPQTGPARSHISHNSALEYLLLIEYEKEAGASDGESNA